MQKEVGQVPTVSVIIPTRNAARWLPLQLAALKGQTVPVSEILVVDSQSEDSTCALAAAEPLCRVMSIRREEFDHGGTRDKAARACKGEYLWFLTQDALPQADCLAQLLAAAAPKDVACAYARQLVDKNDGRIEELNRLRNYPPESFTRSEADIPLLQVRAFFLSDTCCLYKTEIYLKCGGFTHPVPTNEDMLMAATFLRSGYKTAYCAAARVKHSHKTRLCTLYRRNFDIGAFMQMFSQQLCGVQAQGAGKKYAFSIMKQLLREGRVLASFSFGLVCVCRLLGYRAGQKYTSLSENAILKKTQNPVFWNQYFQNRKLGEDFV